MRLLSIHVRNYRIHQDLQVELDPRLTLIGGPNESGKSTLAEAAHRALFLRAKGNNELTKAARSNLHGGNPEVEVTFEAGGREYRVHKVFSGNNGTALLQETGGKTWHGDDAEKKLLELLAADNDRITPSRVPSQWSHLWAWQGEVADEPVELVNDHHDDLIQLLQQHGGAIVQMSEWDQAVAGRIEKSFGEIYNKNGSLKAGSKCREAEECHKEASTKFDAAQQEFDLLQKAIHDVTVADGIIAEQGEALEKLHQAAAKLEERGKAIGDRKVDLAKLEAAASNATAEWSTLNDADQTIKNLRSKIATLQEDLAPGQAEQSRLTDARKEAEGQEKTALAELLAAGKAVNQARAHHALGEDYVRWFALAEEIESLAGKLTKANDLRDMINACREELARLPEVDANQNTKLKALHKKYTNLKIQLKAVAARVELIAGSTDVSLDGQSLATGESRVITDEAEIALGAEGELARLKIIPGGGGSLADLRQSKSEAWQDFQDALGNLRVNSLEAAAAANSARIRLQNDISAHQGMRDVMGGDKLKTDHEKAVDEQSALRAKITEQHTKLPDFNQPSDAEVADSLKHQLTDSLGTCESNETAARTLRDTLAAQCQTAIDDEDNHRKKIVDQESALNHKRVRLKVELETHGEEESRTQELAELDGKKREATAKHQQAKNEFDALKPDDFDDEQRQNKTSIEEAQNLLEEAKVNRAQAGATFTADGRTDPKANLETARQQERFARTQLDSEQTRAEATKLLQQLFTEEQQQLAGQYGQRLAVRIQPYLDCIFDRARIHIGSTGREFGEFTIARPSHQSAAFEFKSLSTGTREQAAAALRLAMAEILAAEHDGCLPVVLDDPFANSDPDRVQKLQRMLDRAASNGLQVIVLTCTPGDYAALGAKQIRITPDPS